MSQAAPSVGLTKGANALGLIAGRSGLALQGGHLHLHCAAALLSASRATLANTSQAALLPASRAPLANTSQESTRTCAAQEPERAAAASCSRRPGQRASRACTGCAPTEHVLRLSVGRPLTLLCDYGGSGRLHLLGAAPRPARAPRANLQQGACGACTQCAGRSRHSIVALVSVRTLPAGVPALSQTCAPKTHAQTTRTAVALHSPAALSMALRGAPIGPLTGLDAHRAGEQRQRGHQEQRHRGCATTHCGCVSRCS